MNTGKTIKQIAEELGVSKQAVFKKIKKEPLSTSLRGLTVMVDGRLMVLVDGEKLIKREFLKDKPSTTVNQVDGLVDGLVDDSSTRLTGDARGKNELIAVLQTTITTLREQLEVKDHQLEAKDQQLAAKDKQIEQLEAVLTAAQQTAAAAQQTATIAQQAVAGAQALHAGTMQQQILELEDGKQKKGWFRRWREQKKKKSDDNG